jgi:seryl-tRNA synthetase
MNKQQKIKATSKELEKLDRYLSKRMKFHHPAIPHLFDERDVWMTAKNEEDAKELKRKIKRHAKLYDEHDRLTGCITN